MPSPLIELFDEENVVRKIQNKPKPGTNPRGVEISREALHLLINHRLTKKIEIHGERKEIQYDPYKRWLKYWEED